MFGGRPAPPPRTSKCIFCRDKFVLINLLHNHLAHIAPKIIFIRLISISHVLFQRTQREILFTPCALFALSLCLRTLYIYDCSQPLFLLATNCFTSEIHLVWFLNFIPSNLLCVLCVFFCVDHNKWMLWPLIVFYPMVRGLHATLKNLDQFPQPFMCFSCLKANQKWLCSLGLSKLPFPLYFFMLPCCSFSSWFLGIRMKLWN